MTQTMTTPTRKTGDVKSNEVVLDAIDELHITIPDRRRKPVPLTVDEARDLTIEIRRTSVRLWILVVEAHDRQAHLALGYETWADYVQAELKMSESRSYQLLDTGHVMKELAVAGVDIDHMDPPPTRVVARVKDRLPAVRKTAQDAVQKGHDVDKAIRSLAREPRKGAAIPPQARAAASSSTSAPAASVAGTAQATEAPVTGVKCPACGGTGRVDRSLAAKLRPVIKKLSG